MKTTQTTDTLELTLTSSDRGYLDFNIKGAGTIRRATVAHKIKHGDTFHIYYGDGEYTPHQKEPAAWLGYDGTSADILNDLKKSILSSSVFIGESINSGDFYTKVAKQFSKCQCDEPALTFAENKQVIAVDLDYPEYARNSSRSIVFLGSCQHCNKELTYGTGFGSFCTTGETKLKELAEKEAQGSIDFDSIITSASQLQ